MKESCANCGRVIGNLETPHVLAGHVVCADCVPRLNANVIPVTPPTAFDVLGRPVLLGIIISVILIGLIVVFIMLNSPVTR